VEVAGLKQEVEEFQYNSAVQIIIIDVCTYMNQEEGGLSEI